jgi:hypothetical protein
MVTDAAVGQMMQHLTNDSWRFVSRNDEAAFNFVSILLV